MASCIFDEKWSSYIIVSLITFFGGLVILIPCRIFWYICGQERRSILGSHKGTQSNLSRVRFGAEKILSGNTNISKVVLIVFWLVDMTGIGIYLTEATFSDRQDRSACGSVLSDPLQYVWMIVMFFSFIRYIIKFIAAQDKTLMWIDIYSIVDHFTIGPTIVGLYLDRNWLGLRFLRIVHFLRTADILQLVYLLKVRNNIRIVKIGSSVFVIWIFGAGMMHLLENSGNPLNDNADSVVFWFWDSFYFILITLTTIGYGDFSPKTEFGKAFIIIFVVLTLAMFASLVPELAVAVSSRTRYRSAYQKSYGKSHVVICGGLTFDSVRNVVKNFIHEDASVQKTDLVVIDTSKPSSELQAFFRRRFNDVTFIVGSVLDMPTLQLAKVRSADAVLILANRRSSNKEEEDMANIMRATAVKNYSSDARIVIQLLCHQNKKQLFNIPSWKPYENNGDEIICISDLKMGFMAQTCCAPGIVTMLSNLLSMRSFKETHSGGWMDEYLYGTGHEVYTASFPAAFLGITFAEAVEICFSRFGVLLVAVSCQDGTKKTAIKINPGRSFKILENHVGFFIAQSPSDIDRIKEYKPVDGQEVKFKPAIQNNLPEEQKEVAVVQKETKSVPVPARRALDFTKEQNNNNNNIQESGSFGKAILESKIYNFKDHIIFVIHSDTSTSVPQELGLIDFVQPLREGLKDWKTIIFYAELATLEKEWNTIEDFSDVFVYQRSKTFHSDLRALNIQDCAMCIVMSTTDMLKIDDILVDNHAILTTMNILSLIRVDRKARSTEDLTTKEEGLPVKQVTSGGGIPMLTVLEYDESVVYIDDEDDDDLSLPLYQTTPYACGNVLFASVFDSLVSSTYMNPDVLRLIETLVIGGHEAEFRRANFGSSPDIRLKSPNWETKSSSLVLLDVSAEPLNQINHENAYGRLVTNALHSFGLLCLGVQRLLTTTTDNKDTKRYVITSPAYDFQLRPTDMVYALKPFDFDIQKCKENFGVSTKMSPEGSSSDTNQQLKSLKDETRL